MSVQEEREIIIAMSEGDFKRISIEAVLNRLTLEVQAEMPCYLYDPKKPNDGLPFMQDCGCVRCAARRQLAVPV